MRYLLDTHVFVWYLADAPALSKAFLKRIQQANVVYVSAASIWEAAIKIQLKKLQANLDDLLSGIEMSGFVELSVSGRHVSALHLLPPHHRDPFDRILLAQSHAEACMLLTADSMLLKYGPWVERI
jgi:PIN domain nuclease of toxin-antitoxin system